MMKVFDSRIPIHETPEGEPSIHETIKKLSEMLTFHQVDHCFTLPTGREIDNDEKPLVYLLMYDSEKNVEITLVVSLFLKIYLNRSGERILQAITKSFL